MSATIIHADCREAMAAMEPASVDAIVCDPPYGLGFMGKGWDHGVPGREFWTAALRVAKPGAHLVAFGGTRTFHRLTVAIEDAGWEIRDCLSWLYGSGFPKSLDVSKAIDKAAGTPSRLVSERPNRASFDEDGEGGGGFQRGTIQTHEPVSDLARAWQGWGTALKPAWEPIILARKPLAGTVAANVTTHGTGALNVDGCRIAAIGRPNIESAAKASVNAFGDGLNGSRAAGVTDLGRWPANVVLDEDAAAMLDAQAPAAGAFAPVRGTEPSAASSGTVTGLRQRVETHHHGDGLAGASRFFYTAKASRSEREAGAELLPRRRESDRVKDDGPGGDNPRNRSNRSNHHPTVKPVDLMRWLCRLVTPRGGLVLGPFCGSGSTGVAAIAEGFRFVGVEREAEYVAIARARVAHQQGPLFWEATP